MIINDNISLLLENMISGFAYHKIVTDENSKPIDYIFIEINSAFEKFTGLLRENIIGKKVTEIIPNIKCDEFNWIEFYGNVALTGVAATFEQYSKALNKWYSVNVYATGDGYFATIFNDITIIKQKELELKQSYEELNQTYEELMASEEELRQQNDELTENKKLLSLKEDTLQKLAYFDSITGLPNRTMFIMELNNYIRDFSINNKEFAVLYMDVDNFKHINDTYGYIFGDKIINEIGHRIVNELGKNDFIARIGGDEFAVITGDCLNINELILFSEKLKDYISDPFVFGENTCYTAISIGVAIYPYNGVEAYELFKNADIALHRSKQNGKNIITLFSNAMKDEQLRKSKIERLIRSALFNKEFLLYLQPQFYVKSNRLRGFEALIRWDNKDSGMISPMYFIPIAEQTGLIIPLGKWIIEESCRIKRMLIEKYNFDGVLSINISPYQLKDKGFTNFIMQEICKNNLSLQKIELEITESVFINNYDFAISIINELKSIGFKISLDDFGTGYSSLSYLKRLPLDVLKIDKAFIKNVSENSVDKEICYSILNLAQKLNIETVAEGVETVEQLQYLRNTECTYYQGFLSGKPVPLLEAVELITKYR
jgi:diguanylate cyclase (GGDEF)-like protein